MTLTYQKLFTLMEERGVRKIDLRGLGIHSKTVNRLTKDGEIQSSSILKLCEILKCQPGDIMECVGDGAAEELPRITPADLKRIQKLRVLADSYVKTHGAYGAADNYTEEEQEIWRMFISAYRTEVVE